MNSERRKEIQSAIARISEARVILEEVLEAEQEAFDNLPESLQSGDKGEKMQENISSLEAAITDLENAEASAEDAARE